MSKKRPNINKDIAASHVRLIMEGEQFGVVSIEDALAKAESLQMDLVEVGTDGDTPTCKIMDYGKYLYKKKKQEQRQRQSHRQKEQKAVRLGVSTDVHDLKVKEDNARRFLTKGHPVKVMLVLRGREHIFKDLAREKIQDFAERLTDAGKIEENARKQGSNFIIILSPLK